MYRHCQNSSNETASNQTMPLKASLTQKFKNPLLLFCLVAFDTAKDFDFPPNIYY